MGEIISSGLLANGKPPTLPGSPPGKRERVSIVHIAGSVGRNGSPQLTVSGHPGEPDVQQRLREEYRCALRRYLAAGGESELHQAYELGRTASKAGIGVLDVVRLHHAATESDDRAPAPANSEAFLLEALSPFEASHRGFRQAHDELRQRERQLAEAQQLASLGSFEWDWRTDRISMSDELYRIQGLAPQRGPQGCEDLLRRIHPDDRDGVRKILQDAVQRGESFAVNKRIVTPSGRVRQVHLRGEIISDTNKQPLRLVGFCQDVTEQCRAEEMWRRYETIINTTREHLVLIDRRYRYQAVNDAYCEAQGLPRAELVGRSLREIWDAGIFDTTIRPHLDQCLAGDDVTAQGWLRLPQAGLRFYEFNCYPYRRGSRVTHAIVVARDITERRRMEEELQESRAHYRRLFNESSGMEETLRRLSNRILHAQEEERAHLSRELHDEVGQALNAISMNLGALSRIAGNSSGTAAAKIADTLELVSRTVETVHRFARELRPAMLDELGLEAALRACVRAFSERTGLTVEFHGRLPGKLLAADQRTVIYRVAQESLNNVAKHAGATHVDVILWREGGQAILEIRDNGCGFAPTPRQVEPNRQRLGLLGMEERVRLVNGTFNIESRPGAGTIVRVEIPLSASSRRAAVAGGSAATEPDPTPTPLGNNKDTS